MFLITTHRLSVQQTRFSLKFGVFTVKSPALLSELQQRATRRLLFIRRKPFNCNPLNVFVLILEKNFDVLEIEFIDKCLCQMGFDEHFQKWVSHYCNINGSRKDGFLNRFI